MVDEKVIQLLQEQFNKERQNSQVYSCIFNICKNMSYDGFAKFFMKQSQQELEHAQMVADFLISKRVEPRYGILTSVDLEEDLVRLAKSAYDLELGTTKSLEMVYYASDSSGESQVCAFLVDMLKEQIEEETWSYDLLDLLSKTDANGWVVLDHQYGEKV